MTTAELLDRLECWVLRFVVVPEHAAPTVALWVLHAWALKAFAYSPPLAVTSPTKRCGKTRLLEVIELVVPRAWRVISPSEATLFRTIELEVPTLLLDEVDTIFRKERDPSTEGLRAIINAGNARGVTIPRCVPPSQAVKRFSIFSPKVLAGIGDCLPDTVSDRSIPLRLVRRTAGEHVERFRRRDIEPDAIALREHLEAWGETSIPELVDARPLLPDWLDDRQQDGWEPLLAIADLAGGEWPTRARRAALTLHATAAAGEADSNCVLLQAIKEVFIEKGINRMSTIDLVEALVAREGEPWGAWWGAAIDKGNTRGAGFKLSKALKPFGITARSQRVGDARGQGYDLADFADAFTRYLKDLTTGQSLGDKGLRAFQGPDTPPPVRSSKTAESLAAEGVSGCQILEPLEQVADESGLVLACICGGTTWQRRPDDETLVCEECLAIANLDGTATA